MTTEEKAKVYDEALEKARKELNTCGSLDCDAARQILRFFPQLRESNDERIRKYLIEELKAAKSVGELKFIIQQPTREGCIAYLEKQKENHEEPKIASGDWGDKEKKEAIITCLQYMRFIKKITNQEYDDLAEWLNDNLVSNVLEKDGWTIANEQTDTIKEDYYGAFLRGEMRGYLRASKEKKPIKVYRVENEDKQKGLWRKFDGTWEPLFNMLTDGLCKNLPMEDNDRYRAEGKKWFASAPSRETLQKWFSKRDLEELTAAGFTISEFEVTNYKKVSEFEYIFTRDSIVNRTYLTVSDIYPEQKPVPISCSHENGTPAERKATINGESIQTKNQSVDIPLAEWSEEDEKMINTLVSYVEDPSCWNLKCPKEKLVAFIKSLRPSWKPSEEQMKALNALNCQGDLSYVGQQNQLISLYNDLKKLM